MLKDKLMNNPSIPIKKIFRLQAPHLKKQKEQTLFRPIVYYHTAYRPASLLSPPINSTPIPAY